MIAALAVLPRAIDLGDLAVVAAIWGVLTAGSLALVLWLALALPADYFEREPPARSGWTLGRLARNAIGLVLILVGLVLSIPGIPGQGLLTVLVGLFLVDFPGRRRLECRIARRPQVLGALNRLRARFDRPPLLPPPP